MNWDALGAIGELAGALAVVLSLIYVARQVHAGRAALETSTRDSVFRQLQEWNHVVMADPVLGDLFQRGMEDLDSLDRVERARMVHTMYSFFKVFESIYLHHLAGSIPADLWEGNFPILALYASQPGGRAYWMQRRVAFDARFIQVLEGLGDSSLQPAARLDSEPGS